MAKKKKNKKIIIAELPKPEVSEEEGRIVASLTSLQATEGWALIVKILNDNIKYLEEAILDKKDPITKLPIKEEDMEVLRIKRSLNIDLRDTPQNFIKSIREGSQTEENYDPYFRTNDEIKKEREARQ